MQVLGRRGDLIHNVDGHFRSAIKSDFVNVNNIWQTTSSPAVKVKWDTVVKVFTAHLHLSQSLFTCYALRRCKQEVNTPPQPPDLFLSVRQALKIKDTFNPNYPDIFDSKASLKVKHFRFGIHSCVLILTQQNKTKRQTNFSKNIQKTVFTFRAISVRISKLCSMTCTVICKVRHLFLGTNRNHVWTIPSLTVDQPDNRWWHSAVQ